MALFNIIRDTREQTGWSFTRSKNIGNIIDKKLDTGDYSISGFETQICIERKRSTGEIAANMFEKRFQRELERMKTYKYRFIIMEFSVDNILNFPNGSGIPKGRHKFLHATPPMIMKFLNEIQIKNNISIIYAGNIICAEFIVDSLLKRLWEELNG